MDDELPPDAREAALEYVLREVHPDGLEAEVIGARETDGGHLVGVKAPARGYLGTAAYALVTVDSEGRVVDAEERTGRAVRRELGAE